MMYKNNAPSYAQCEVSPPACEAPKLELIENSIRVASARLDTVLDMLGSTAERVFGPTLGNTPTDKMPSKEEGTALGRINDALRRLDNVVEAVDTQARRFPSL